MTSTTAIKIVMGCDMRKIQLSAIDFALLEEAVSETYGDGPFHISYEDVEGDEITVSSSSELREAIRYANELERSAKLLVVEQPVVVDLKDSGSKSVAQALQREAILGLDHEQLRRTHTKVTQVADMVAGTQIYSDRRGEVFSFKLPKNRDTPAKTHKLAGIGTFNKQQLRPTQTKVTQVADMLAGTQVYSERRGKAFSFKKPKKASNRVKQLEGITETRKHLRPTKTKLIRVADMLAGTQVYSARQGKAFTFSVPKAQVSKRQRPRSNSANKAYPPQHINDAIKAFPRQLLRPTTTDVKQLCDVMAGKKIYSQRRARVFCFASPVPQKRSQNQKLKKRFQKHSLRLMEQALSHQKRKLRHTSTCVKQICDVVEGMPVFSERRGRVFFFKSPVSQRLSSSSSSPSSTLPRSLLDKLSGFDCNALRHTVPRVRNLSDVYAGCKVFSKRRGRAFSYKQPVPQPHLSTSAISTPLRNNKDSALLAQLHCGKKLQPVTPRVTHLSDMFKGQEVWSQRRGRAFQYKRPKLQPGTQPDTDPGTVAKKTQSTEQTPVQQDAKADTLTSLGLGNPQLNRLLLAHFQGDLHKAAQALLLMAKAKQQKDTYTPTTHTNNTSFAMG